MPRGSEGAQKRPFRKLKATRVVLVTTIITGLAVAGIMQLKHVKEAREAAAESRQCESCRQEVDSVSLGRIAAFLEATGNRKGGRIGRDSLVHAALEEYGSKGSYKWFPRPGAEWPWEIGYPDYDDYGPGQGWPWECRGNKYVGNRDGEDLGNGRRAKDSLMLLGILRDTMDFDTAVAGVKAVIMKWDSARLIEAVKYAEKPDRRLSAAGWRGAFIRGILNTTGLMLPEARERGDDSLLLCSLAARQVQNYNLSTLEALHHGIDTYRYTRGRDGVAHENSDAYCTRKRHANALKEYEEKKLPDGHSREQDSLEIVKRFDAIDYKQHKAYEEYLDEKEPHVSGAGPKSRSSGWYGNGTEYCSGCGR